MLADLSPLTRFALTLAIAFAGGGVFAAIGLPAHWLAGAMLSTAVASLKGLPIFMPLPVRYAAFVVLGLQVGAGFTRESLASIGQWPVSLLVLALTVAALIWTGYLVLTRLFDWDRKTAFFASNPGAFAMTLAIAEHYGADLRKVAANQSMRLFLLVALLPLAAMNLTNQAMPATSGSMAAGPVMTLAVLCAGAITGYVVHRLGAPAGFLLGAMLANAVLHLSGLVSGGVPDMLSIPAFVILGTMVGVRFQDFDTALLRQVLAAGAVGFVVSIIVAASGASLTSSLTGLPLMATLLAFAPGGLEVMTILAFALGVNPAFVATHQLVRYVGLNLSIPIVAQLLGRRTGK